MFRCSVFLYCFSVLSVDAIDMSGKHEVDLDTNIWKVSDSFVHMPHTTSFPTLVHNISILLLSL